MLRFNIKPPIWQAVVVIAIVTGSLTGCAGSGASSMSTASFEQPRYHCANGGKPTCTTYLGKTVRCSCASRADFERLFNDY